MNEATAVVKVGGSLLEVPDLGRRLSNWRRREAPRRHIVVIGGGPAADVIRRADQLHTLGEERSHWLALRALTLNAYLLAELLSNAEVVLDLATCQSVWERGKSPVLDPHAFMQADEGQAGALPHRWDVTSDSLAARVAEVAGASRLVLLKQCSAPQGSTLADWARLGLVDAWFPRVAARLPGGVRFVNFQEAA